MSVWKPGDVAIAQWKHFPGVPAIYTSRGWIDADNAEFDGGEDDLALRPLVVIDPEDRASIERLRDIYDREIIQQNDDPDPRDVTPPQRGNALSAALREYANPTPRIEEPTGLGAVVQSADGLTFVRVAQHFDGWAKDRDWQRIGGELNAVRNFGWRDIDAVRVLSPGVTEAAS